MGFSKSKNHITIFANKYSPDVIFKPPGAFTRGKATGRELEGDAGGNSLFSLMVDSILRRFLKEYVWDAIW